MPKNSISIRRILLPVFTFAGILLIWEFAVSRGWISSIALSSPSAAIGVAIDSFSVMLPHILITTRDTLLTFLLSAFGGILLGALLMYFRGFRAAVYPSIVMFQLLPKVALAPLFVVWFGVAIISRVTFATFISFFPVVVATLAGLQATDPLLLKLCRSARASSWQMFWQVQLPSAVPFIMSALKVAMTLAITGVLVSEFVTVQAGLGYIVLLASSNFQVDLMFAALGWIAIVGLALYGAVLLLEKVVDAKMGVPIMGASLQPG